MLSLYAASHFQPNACATWPHITRVYLDGTHSIFVPGTFSDYIHQWTLFWSVLLSIHMFYIYSLSCWNRTSVHSDCFVAFILIGTSLTYLEVPESSLQPSQALEPMSRAPQKHQHTEAQVITNTNKARTNMTQAKSYLLGESSRSLGGAQWDKFAQAFSFWQWGSRGRTSSQPSPHPLSWSQSCPQVIL